MKTKNKILAMLEIAIVLCSVFLVALPVIAGDDQNQTAQKVSASEVTTASEDDFVLDIYGNANEDECIDMRDYTYTARIICWLEDETTFADANYDGRISVADMTQIGLIILGRESELTLIDTAERTVTVKKPLERIVAPHIHPVETLRSLKASDTVVGVGYLIVGDSAFFPEFSEVASVGSPWTPDIEAILSLDPDAVILHISLDISGFDTLDDVQDACEAAGITVLRFNFNEPDIYLEEVKKLGYIVDKEQEAEELLDWLENILNSIEEVVEEIPEEDKPTVYCEANDLYTSYSGYTYIDFTGGIDIFSDAAGLVDAEEVLEQNPDIIVKLVWYLGGYHLDAGDTAELKEERDEIMSRTGLEMVKAVEEGEVYVMSTYIYGAFPYSGCRHFLQFAYQAKWFQPTLFEDLDPKALHQEYLTEFQGLDIDLDEKGMFVYHPKLHPDGS